MFWFLLSCHHQAASPLHLDQDRRDRCSEAAELAVIEAVLVEHQRRLPPGYLRIWPHTSSWRFPGSHATAPDCAEAEAGAADEARRERPLDPAVPFLQWPSDVPALFELSVSRVGFDRNCQSAWVQTHVHWWGNDDSPSFGYCLARDLGGQWTIIETHDI